MSNLKIQTQTGQAEDISKSLIGVQGSPYELESTMPLIERRPVKPQLMTAILGAVINKQYETGDTFVYDSTDYGVALPSGKRYDAIGARVSKEKAKTFRWGIPSFGISGNVMAKDWANKRKAGTVNEFMTEADVLAKVNTKIGNGWDLFMEQQLINLITTDTNSVAGGPFDSFNFYTEIVGGSRTTNNISFSTAANDHAEEIRKQKKELIEEMIKAGENTNVEIVVVCGSNFFDAVHELEKNEDNPRELKSTYDFTSQEMTAAGIGSESFQVDNFVGSRSGVRFIEFTANVGGVTIGDDDAYMLPVASANLVNVAYAPCQDREHANTVAQEKYGWADSNRVGVTVYEESNFLAAMTNPRLVRKLGMS